MAHIGFKPTRVWVNSPSTKSPYHQYHGMVGIAIKERETGYVTVYFCHGDVSDAKIAPLWLETLNSHTNVFKYSKP